MAPNPEKQPPISTSVEHLRIMEQSADDAEELFMLMEGDVRVSRNVRAKWFFDHLGQYVGPSEASADKDGIRLVGCVGRDGHKQTRAVRVSNKTVITYFSNCYRLIFVMDLSPSAFATDDSGDGTVFYTRILNSFCFPGSNVSFEPQVYVTFVTFTPFLSFTQESILLQGVLLSARNVDLVVMNLEHKFKQFVNDLCSFCQPHLHNWQIKRRQFRKYANELAAALYSEQHDDEDGELVKTRKSKGPRGLPKLETDHSDSSVIGFIQPDWALIFMVRLGLMAVQMLPENTQSNLIVVTDGICGIPDPDALQALIDQLRSHTVTCSFVQLQQSSLKGSVLGHVGFSDLLRFLARATFGKFLFENGLPEAPSGQLNFYHRAFLSWNFQRAYDLDPKSEIENEFDAMEQTLMGYSEEVTRSRRFSHTYSTSLYDLMYVRLREGYAIRSVSAFVRDGQDMIRVKLCLLRKPKVTVDYIISAPWTNNFHEVSDMFVEIYVEGITDFYNRDLPDPMKLTITRVTQVDTLMVHMHMFNRQPGFYTIPKEMHPEAGPLFEQKKGGKIVLCEKYRRLQNKPFTRFWYPACNVDESMWQKWVHMHTLRLLLVEDDLMPKQVFTKSDKAKTMDEVTCHLASRKIIELLSAECSFTLIKDKCFVKFLKENNDDVPRFFYIIRVQFDIPCVILKIAFLGGMSNKKRSQIVNDLRSQLTTMTIHRSTSFMVKSAELWMSEDKNKLVVARTKQNYEVPLLRIIHRPLERILVRYSKVPQDISKIVRLEDTSDQWEIREMVMHNAISKYLSCRRVVWELKPVFPKLKTVSLNSMEFILQVILRRRLKQGFNVAYGCNGIVNLARQLEPNGPTSLPRVEQCVLFGPVFTDTELINQSSAGGLDDEVENNLPRPTRPAGQRPTVWPRIATEVWQEPKSELEEVDEEQSDPHMIPPLDFDHARREQLLREDDSIVRSLFTFDQLMHATESGLYAEEAHHLDKVASVITREHLSAAVDSFQDVFDPKALMEHADTREFMLMPALGYSESDSNDDHVNARLESLLKFIQSELTTYAECCVDVLDDAFLWDIVENCEQHFGINRFYSPDNSTFSDTFCNAENRLKLTRTAPTEFKTDISSTTRSECSTTNFTPEPDLNDSENILDEEMERQTDPLMDSPLNRSLSTTLDPHSDSTPARSPALAQLQHELKQQRSTSVPTFLDPPDLQTGAMPKSLLDVLDEAIAYSSSSVNDIGSGSSGGFEDGSPSRKPSGTADKSRHTSGQNARDRERNMSGSPVPRPLPPPRETNEDRERRRLTQMRKFPPSPLGGFGLYARRINSHRLALFAVPKNAKTVRLLMPHCMSGFPIFVYYVDKLRMAQRFVEQDFSMVHQIETIVEDFTQKAKMSTLASLNMKIKEIFVGASMPLDEFYLRGLETDPRPQAQLPDFHLTSFDLRSYAEQVFEEYMFTKAFVAATFISIGQKVYVPKSVLEEATEFRSEHISLEVGPLQEMMRLKCLHLNVYEQIQNHFTNSNSNLDPVRLEPLPSASDVVKFQPKKFFRLFNGCLSNFNEWKDSFQRLLSTHHFQKVPCLDDYYYYWPHGKPVIRFPNVDDVSNQFKTAYRAVGDHSNVEDAQSNANDVYEPQPFFGDTDDDDPVHLSSTDLWPLFVQFSVAVIGPDGDMDSFPMPHVPSCLCEVASRCNTHVLRPVCEGIAHTQELRIVVDLYILSWPLPASSPFQLTDPHLTYARYQANQQQHELDQSRFDENPCTDGESSDDGASYNAVVQDLDCMPAVPSKQEGLRRANEFLGQLPKGEYAAISQLHNAVKRMISTELFFDYGRKCERPPPEPQPSWSSISQMFSFVRHIAHPSESEPVVVINYPEATFQGYQQRLVLIGDVEDGVSRLSKRLENHSIDYIRLRRLNLKDKTRDELEIPEEYVSFHEPFDDDPDPIVFYACGVDDMDRLEEVLQQRFQQQTPSQKRRASSCGLVLEKVVRDLPEQPSSSEISESESETIDLVEPLNDRAESDGSVPDMSERRPRLRRQLSRYYSANSLSRTSSTTNSRQGLDDLSLDDDDDIQVLSSDSEDKVSQADGFLVGSDCGTWIAEEQVQSGETAPVTPQKAMNESKTVEMRNGYPLEWLKEIGVYGEKEADLRLTEKKEAYSHDFWLLIHVRRGEQYTTSVYFFCRFNSPHKSLFHQAVYAVEKQIKVVNQQLLLEAMQKTEECDELLLDAPEARHQPVEVHQPQQRRQVTFFAHERLGHHVRNFVRMPSETENDNSSDSEDSIVEEPAGPLDTEWMHYARCKYPAGYFACDLVWHHWFEIHPRLQPTNRMHSGSEIGLKSLQMGLELFAVRNRPNVYVFKEQNGNVIYMKLFPVDEQQLIKEFSKTPKKLRPGIPPRCRPGTHVLWAVYGIHEPSEEVTQQMRDMLQKKLDTKTLEEIQKVLLKNAQVRLDISDARFIQRDPHQPSRVFFYTLPKSVAPFQRAMLSFLEQQMETFCTLPHVREHSGNFGATTPSTPRSPNPTSQSSSSMRTHHASAAWAFWPFVPEGAPNNPPLYIPRFFLLNRPPGEGKRDVGLACIEVKLLNTKLEWIAQPTHKDPFECPNVLAEIGRANQNVTVAERMDRLKTLSQSYAVESPFNVDRTELGALLEFNVWQNGNVNLDELDQKFTVSIRQAICDLLTEYGLLSMCIFDSNNVQSTTGSFSLPPIAKPQPGMDPHEIAVMRAQQLQRHEADLPPRRATFSAHTKRMTSDGAHVQMHAFNQPQCPPSPVHAPASQPNPGFNFGASAINLDDEFFSRATAALVADYRFDGTNTGSPGTNSSGASNTSPASADPKSQYYSPQTPALSSTAMGIYGFYQHEDNMTPPSSVYRTPAHHSGGNSAQQKQQSSLQSTQPSTFSGTLTQMSSTNRSSSGSGGAGTRDVVRQSSTALQFGVAETLGKSVDESQLQQGPHTQVGLPPRLSSMGSNPASAVLNAAATAISNLTKPDAHNRQRQSSNRDTPNPASVPPTTTANQSPLGTPVPLEWLRPDFAQVAADWLDLSIQETKNLVNMDNTVKRCTFMLDCDGSARKIMQVVYDRIKLIFKTERVTICRCVAPTPGVPQPEFTFPSGRRLQTLNSVNTLLEPMEKDFGRAVMLDEDEEIELALVVINEQQFKDAFRGSQTKAPGTMEKFVQDAQGGRVQRFPPISEPFIPRKRIMYVLARGETISMFLYNYSKDLCDRAREVLKRTVLWHNARSRLLREIGLHKMGVTHLSTLKTTDTKYNPYLVLTWLDPETLVKNDYPPDDLKTPDFSKIPKKYAQLLLKLYRFSDSAFVAKHFSADPFEDQTRQMLTLREDVRAKLNDHHLFDEIHRRLMNGITEVREDGLLRITARSHHAHYVQSPLLLFTSWRYQIAQIRKNLASHVGIPGKAADGGVQGAVMTSLPPPPKKRTKERFQNSPEHEKEKSHTGSGKAKTKNSSGPSTKSRSKTVTAMDKVRKSDLEEAQVKLSLVGANSAPLHTTLPHPKIEDEFCIIKIQYMLVEEYVHYLQGIGLNLLRVISDSKSQAYNLQYTVDCTQAPNVWLYLARPGGIIFAHVTFVEPYFAVNFLFWNASQLDDHFYAGQGLPPQELEDMRQVELLKNDLISRCHVHSFTYDFHLRMVSKYLTGGQQVLFNRGYNTNAFIIDFLQYYGCRPPFALNCIYEDKATFASLKVTSLVVWEYFLANEAQFGWEVIRIKNVEANEYMLVSKQAREMAGQRYTLITLVMNDTRPEFADQHKIDLKVYVILVADEYSKSITGKSDLSVGRNDRRKENSGDTSRRNLSSDSVTTWSTSHLREPTYSGSNSSNASGAGGEFTRVERPNVLSQQDDSRMSRQLAAAENYRMLDELIALSTDELMYDVGIRPTASSVKGFGSNKRAHHSGDMATLRRSSTTGVPSSDADFESSSQLAYRNSTEPQTPRTTTKLQTRSASTETKRSSEARHCSQTPIKSSSTSRKLGGSLTRLNYSDKMDELWRHDDSDSSFVSFDLHDKDKMLSIQKSPLRRHHQAYLDGLLKRQSDAVLPPEQVTYVHYLSNQQRRLQHILEESARLKREELQEFVYDHADRICYVESLWKRLVSSRTSSSSRSRTHANLFGSSTPKNDSNSSQTRRQPPEMNFTDLESLLAVVKVEPLTPREPRLSLLLQDVNLAQFCRFIKLHPEFGHLYSAAAESAFMLVEDEMDEISLHLLIKETVSSEAKSNPAQIYRQLEEVVNLISAFVLLDLAQHVPTLP